MRVFVHPVETVVKNQSARDYGGLWGLYMPKVDSKLNVIEHSTESLPRVKRCGVSVAFEEALRLRCMANMGPAQSLIHLEKDMRANHKFADIERLPDVDQVKVLFQRITRQFNKMGTIESHADILEQIGAVTVTCRSELEAIVDDYSPVCIGVPKLFDVVVDEKFKVKEKDPSTGRMVAVEKTRQVTALC